MLSSATRFGLILGTLVSVWYTVNGPFNAMGWSAVVIYGVFFYGCVSSVTTGRVSPKIAELVSHTLPLRVPASDFEQKKEPPPGLPRFL